MRGRCFGSDCGRVFLGSQDGHQDGLAVRPALAAIAVAVLADDHRRADRPFGAVVLEGDVRLAQEREHVVPVAAQALDEPPGVPVRPGRVEQLLQAGRKPGAARSVLLRRSLVAPTPQPHRIAHQAQLLGKLRPLHPRRLVLLRIIQLAQRMHQARLTQRADHRVVSAPKVAHQGPRKFLHEELHQGRRATAAVDHVIGQVSRRKAPQPVRFAVHPPAALVGVKHCRMQGFPLNLLVPGIQYRLQAIPHLCQAAGRDLHLQVEVEHLHDLRERVAQGVVQPGRQHQHAVAERAAGQGVGHDRLDLHLTAWAPVAVDHVFGHFRLDVRNVFGIAGACLRTALQPAATPGRTIGPVFLAVVDALGRLSPRPRMARLGTGAFFPRFSRRFLVGRLHARRRGRRLVRVGRHGRPLLLQLLGQLQQRKDHRLRTLRVDHPRLLFGQHPPAKNIQQTVRQSRLACCHTQNAQNITPESSATNFRLLKC